MSLSQRKLTVRRAFVGLVAIALCLLPQGGSGQPTQPESRYSRPAEREIRFQEGVLRYSGGRLKEAENDFQAILQEDPADSEAWYFLGLSQLDQGRPAEAVNSLNQSLRLEPTSDEVRAARARAHILLRNFDAARDDLQPLSADPKWQALVDYLRGQLLYAEGDLEGAAKAFAAAKKAGSTESEPAGFYEGLTYLRMRELTRARSTFRESALGADRDATVASASRQLDAVLAAQQRQAKPWEFQLTTSYEYDSNVILISPDIPTPVGVSNEADNRLVLQPRGSYSFYRKGPTDLGIEASGYFSFQQDLTDFNVASYQAGPYINYRFRDNLYLSARYGYNYIEQGHEEFLQRHIITPQVTLLEPNFGYTSVYGQYQDRRFAGEDVTPEADRDGPLYSVGIVQGVKLPEFFEGAGPGNVEVSYRFEHQDTDGSDFEGNFHSVGATLFVPLPVWKLRADFGVSFDYDDYSNANSIDVDNDVRRDHEINVVAGITKEFNEYWAFRVDYIYTDHESNIEQVGGQNPFDFDRHQVGVRLIFSY
jgi:tetratricopeptide (TPR) repeat protein